MQYIKYAIKSFHHSPKLSLSILLILSIGIGTATSIFSLIHGIILRPLPFDRSEQLFIVSGAATPPDGDALAWWGQNEAFESLCEYASGGLNFTEKERASRLSAAIVSASFFSVFSITPERGRAFTVADEKAGNNQKAVLSELLWMRNYNRNPDVIGQIIKLNGVNYTVIGIMPTNFSFPGQTDVWISKTKGGAYLEVGKDEQSEGSMPRTLRRGMIGRLKPRINQAQAQSQLDALFARLKEMSSQSGVSIGSGVRLTPLRDAYSRNSKAAFWMLFVGVGLLLSISCMNATILILTRAAIRQAEIAMRLCLGATNFRIICQLLTEGIILALSSSAIGVWLAYLLVSIVRTVWAESIPRLSEVRVNVITLGFAVGLSIIVGLIISLAPALKINSLNIIEVLKKGKGSMSATFGQRVRRTLILIEIVLAEVLLIGALLSVQSLLRLTTVETGFDPKYVSTFELALPSVKYNVPAQGNDKSPDEQRVSEISSAKRFYQHLFEKVKTLPNITAIGGVDRLPMNSTSGTVYLDLPETKSVEALITNIAGDYFKALGISLKGGRVFSEQDDEYSAKVIIISESLAQKHFGGRGAIGQSLIIEGENNTREIVGVVGDIRQVALDKESKPQIYLPHSQPNRGMRPSLNLVIVFRSNISPNLVTNDLRSLLSSIDRDLPIFGVRPMEEVVVTSASTYRFRGILLGGFAIIALILAVIGVYSVVSYSALSRVHEIGVRMSLGAKPQNILFMVLREGVSLSLLGVGIGIIISFGLNRYIASLLYGVVPTDKATMILASLTLIICTLLACLIPAFTASKVDPAVALRQE